MSQGMMWVELSMIRSKRVKKEIRAIQEMMWNGTYDPKLKAIIDDNWKTDEEVDDQLGVNEL